MLLEKISRICDDLICSEKAFGDIDKTKLLETISEILNEIPAEQLNISDDELTERLRGVLAIEAVSGILKDNE